MKKSIFISLFVCLAMSINTYAQSDNAAWVMNPGEGQDFRSQGFINVFGGVYLGTFTFVQTKDGTIRGTVNAKLDRGTPVTETTRVTITLFSPIGIFPGELECVLTKSGNGNCHYKVESD